MKTHQFSVFLLDSELKTNWQPQAPRQTKSRIQLLGAVGQNRLKPSKTGTTFLLAQIRTKDIQEHHITKNHKALSERVSGEPYLVGLIFQDFSHGHH